MNECEDLLIQNSFNPYITNIVYKTENIFIMLL